MMAFAHRSYLPGVRSPVVSREPFAKADWLQLVFQMSPPKTGGLGRKILLMGFCLTGVDSGDVLKSELLSSKKLPQGISKHGQLSIIDRGLTPRATRVVHSLEWLFFQFFLILPGNGNMFQV